MKKLVYLILAFSMFVCSSCKKDDDTKENETIVQCKLQEFTRLDAQEDNTCPDGYCSFYYGIYLSTGTVEGDGKSMTDLSGTGEFITIGLYPGLDEIKSYEGKDANKWVNNPMIPYGKFVNENVNYRVAKVENGNLSDFGDVERVVVEISYPTADKILVNVNFYMVNNIEPKQYQYNGDFTINAPFFTINE